MIHTLENITAILASGPTPEEAEGHKLEWRCPKKGESFWLPSARAWCAALYQISPALVRIPVIAYREPTDEDALKRPMVEVRDCGATEWLPKKEMLVRVQPIGQDRRFHVEEEDGDIIGWRYCRMEVDPPDIAERVNEQ